MFIQKTKKNGVNGKNSLLEQLNELRKKHPDDDTLNRFIGELSGTLASRGLPSVAFVQDVNKHIQILNRKENEKKVMSKANADLKIWKKVLENNKDAILLPYLSEVSKALMRGDSKTQLNKLQSIITIDLVSWLGQNNYQKSAVLDGIYSELNGNDVDKKANAFVRLQKLKRAFQNLENFRTTLNPSDKRLEEIQRVLTSYDLKEIENQFNSLSGKKQNKIEGALNVTSSREQNAPNAGDLSDIDFELPDPDEYLAERSIRELWETAARERLRRIEMITWMRWVTGWDQTGFKRDLKEIIYSINDEDFLQDRKTAVDELLNHIKNTPEDKFNTVLEQHLREYQDNPKRGIEAYMVTNETRMKTAILSFWQVALETNGKSVESVKKVLESKDIKQIDSKFAEIGRYIYARRVGGEVRKKMYDYFNEILSRQASVDPRPVPLSDTQLDALATQETLEENSSTTGLSPNDQKVIETYLGCKKFDEEFSFQSQLAENLTNVGAWPPKNISKFLKESFALYADVSDPKSKRKVINKLGQNEGLRVIGQRVMKRKNGSTVVAWTLADGPYAPVSVSCRHVNFTEYRFLPQGTKQKKEQRQTIQGSTTEYLYPSHKEEIDIWITLADPSQLCVAKKWIEEKCSVTSVSSAVKPEEIVAITAADHEFCKQYFGDRKLKKHISMPLHLENEPFNEDLRDLLSDDPKTLNLRAFLQEQFTLLAEIDENQEQSMEIARKKFGRTNNLRVIGCRKIYPTRNSDITTSWTLTAGNGNVRQSCKFVKFTGYQKKGLGRTYDRPVKKGIDMQLKDKKLHIRAPRKKLDYLIKFFSDMSK